MCGCGLVLGFLGDGSRFRDRALVLLDLTLVLRASKSYAMIERLMSTTGLPCLSLDAAIYSGFRFERYAICTYNRVRDRLDFTMMVGGEL